MSVNLPATYTSPTPQNFLAGQVIRYTDMRAVVRAIHHLWAHVGARVAGLAYDNPWQTTSTSYTVTDAGSDLIDLDTWGTCVTLNRLMVNSGADKGGLTLKVYGQNVDVRCTITHADDPGTTITSLVASCGATEEWAEATVYIDWATVKPSSLRVFGLHLHGKVPSTGTASIWAWEINEVIPTVATALPDGA